MTNHNGLTWAIQHLARLKGEHLDLLKLNTCLADMQDNLPARQQLTLVCEALDAELASESVVPEAVDLPFLYGDSNHGWGVVLNQDASGQWLVRSEKEEFTTTAEALAAGAFLIKFQSEQTWIGSTEAGDSMLTKSFIQFALGTIKHYKAELVEASLASFFIGVLAFTTSMFSMQVYDRVIPTRSEYTLLILSLGVMLSILFELAMKYARSKLMDYVVVGVDSRLSREIFHRLLQLRVDQLPPSVGSLAGQLRGYEQLRAFYTSSTMFTLIDLPFGIIFLLGMMAIGSVWVALVPLVFGVLSILIGVASRQRINQFSMDSAAYSNAKTGLLVEAVEGVETIKAGSGGWKFLARWIAVNSHTIKSDSKMRGFIEGIGYISAMTQQLSYAGLVIVGSMLVMQGSMTMGALIACSILSGRVLAPILALPGLLVQQGQAMAALKGIEAIYQLKTDTHGVQRPLVPDHLQGHFKIVSAKFAYPGNPPALVVANLNIQAGENIAILGPIGAGKSTLLRLLSGLYVPQEGQVLLDGLDLSHISRQVISQKVGYLQQDHRLFQGTLRENLLIGMPDPGDTVIKQAMERTGMINFVSAHPKGLDRPIMEGGKGLSGGQRQLLAFTRLILCNPDILLLDEPTASMDDEQERRCIRVMQELVKAGKMLIVVTHKPNILPLVSRIIIVAGHTIAMDGPRDAVLQRLSQPATAQPAPPTVLNPAI
ncbi:ATP-binding cassette domain-containing protein [Limnohabitans sp. JirII-31]|uniref:ATP-binding cassette domain-containing protein n=1 Tax=Limnohabitans sp. JirII-31 TaxID=1977908 RepID=UPI000C1DF01D|nr:ATP-binding cassette domain-containing protein [Limnohabitans sp. JirII-31]PIT72095.1 type I secretion system permease/ATPase [Limnohabitans sp. JirII-31]